MSAPLVSVVIPCFDYGRFLPEAIESALAQTHDAVEVVVVDDGSTDETREVLARYADRVRAIRHRQGGPARARNRGAEAAGGAFVVFLDADDALEPTYVERCLAALRADPRAAFAYTQARFVGASEGVSHWPHYDLQRLKRGNFITVSALLRRDLVGQPPFDPTLPALEDWDFFLGLAERGHGGVLIDEPLLRYRRHPESRSARSAADTHPELSAQIQIARKHRALYSLWEYSRLRAKLLRRRLKHTLRSAVGLRRPARRGHLPGERDAPR